METITREEQFLNAVAEGTPPNIKPVTREELFLAKAAGQDVKTPTPITRKEMFLKQVAENAGGGGGGGGDTTIASLLDGSVVELYSDSLTEICSNGLAGRAQLERVNFPSVKTLNTSCFNSCSALKTIEIPLVETMGNYCFSGCTSLAKVCIPLLTTTGTFIFSNCSALETVDLGKIGTIQSSSFNGCKQLRCLVFRRSYVVSLPANSILGGTQFASGGNGGTALVPRALIESYQTATNWSVLYAAGTCVFLPLEDYTVDGTTTGDIDWDKLEGVTG